MKFFVKIFFVLSVSLTMFNAQAKAAQEGNKPTLVQPVHVVAEPKTARNVKIIDEPITPRNVNVVNTVNVSATQPLNVTLTDPIVVRSESESLTKPEYFHSYSAIDSRQFWNLSFKGQFDIVTVPQGKKLYITDLVWGSQERASKLILIDKETGKTLIGFENLVGGSSLSFRSPIVLVAGQTLTADIHYYRGDLVITGEWVNE